MWTNCTLRINTWPCKIILDEENKIPQFNYAKWIWFNIFAYDGEVGKMHIKA
jgi:hypothetical protein